MSATRSMIGLSMVTLLVITTAAIAQPQFTKERGGYTARSVDRYDVSPGGKLDMKDLIGDVNIQGGSGNQVEVVQIMFLEEDNETDARKAFERFRASVSKSGNSVLVKAPKFTFRRTPNISYEVKLPTQFDASVETSGGDINMSELTGKVELSTSGGDVDLFSIKGPVDAATSGGDISARSLEGTVILKTAGGDVELVDGKVGPFTLKTAGGEIKLRSLKGNADAATAGGDVEASEIEGELDLRTSGGQISLQNVKGSNHRASTSGGDVEARDVEGNVDLKTSGGDVAATRIKGNVYGRTSGGDMEIEAITGDADISTSGGSLRLLGIAGRLSGQTSGGDVSTRVNKGSVLTSPIRLNTSGGRMVIELPADIKATVLAEIRLESSYSDYSIRSDFSSLKIEDEKKGLSGSHRIITATGDINGGGPMIELKTVEGDIYIEKIN